MEDLENLPIEQIINIYREEVDNQTSYDDILQNYDIKTHKGKIIQNEDYENMRNDLLAEIQSKRNYKEDLRKRYNEAHKDIEPELIQNDDEYNKLYDYFYSIPQPTKPYQSPPQIKSNAPINIEDVKLNPVNVNYIDSQLEQARKELQKAEEKFNYLSKLKESINKDKLQDKERQNIFTEQIKKESDEIRDNYDYLATKSKKPINYNEYLEQIKKQNSIIPGLLKYLNEDRGTYEIDFSRFDEIGKKKLKDSLLNWFENKIGKLAITNHYRISYHVGNMWKSAPLNQDTYNKLLNNLREGHLIYDIDEMPNWTYEAGKENKYNLPEWSLFDYIRIEKVIKNNSTYKDNGGHFFEYLANESIPKRVIDYLAKFQIFTCLSLNGKYQREELNDCCFIYAVKQTGKFTEEQLNLMRMRIKSRYLSIGKIAEICEEFKFKVITRKIELTKKAEKIETKGKNFIGYKDASPEMTFNFDLFEEHWMIHIDKTDFTSDFIKHIDEAPEDAFNKRFTKGKWMNTNDESRFISSSNLIKELFKQNKFTPINYATASILKTTLYDYIKDKDFSLEFNENTCLKLIAPIRPKESNKENEPEKTYWYADFEADVSQEIHKPFMCVIQSSDGKINKVFKGEDCAKQFLNYLPDNSVCYFHNFAYDWCMFNKFATSIQKVIKKGSKVYQAKIFYYKKRLTFKDSYAVFMCKLSILPKSFGLKDIKKELFPYKYYTLERLKTNCGLINEAGLNEDKPWNESDYEEFNKNIDLIDNCRISENTFDMYKYAEFYCCQDVRILRESFEKLAEGFLNEFGIDAKTKLTTPALANEYFRKMVYEPNGNMYEVGGHVREFMSKCIYGGRCMTAYNKKWHSTKPIYDFDAVSLYPSAMRRLWCVEGKPEVLNVINPDTIYNSMPDYLQQFNTQNGFGAFVIEIRILKANKHYSFPLIVQKTSEGNLNDDNITENPSGLASQPVLMVVDNIALEDLIEFQQIEFQIVKGYIWNGKRDYKIQEVIQKVFDSRLKYKAEKNPLEQLYKLIMNSSYGKTIQKPVDFDLKFISKWKKPTKSAASSMKEGETSKYERYWQKNYNKIIEVPFENDDYAIIKVRSQIDNHFNLSLLGIQVLSMSKRIMNEVICLAFDIGCHVYYQDTDSIHIEADDLPKLELAFEEKYKRKLCGKSMGQFHSDFPTINNHDEIPKAIESIFVQKKLYIDKLQDSTGDIDYMIRGKGLTQESINYAAKRHGGFMELYKKLYDGSEITFDLTDGQPCFEMRKDFTVSTRKKFERRIKTTYKEGERDKYFEYSNLSN